VSRSNSHPFPWDELFKRFKSGKQPDLLVPKDYWTGERGMPEESYSSQKAKERIRLHFRGWQEKDAERSKVMLVIRKHANGDVQVWFYPAKTGDATGSTAASTPKKPPRAPRTKKAK
jgi:hypothetical protein